MKMNKSRSRVFKIGDEIAYAMPSGMLYGTIVRLLGEGENGAVEIEFEDGRRETKRVRESALSLLRRASGKSEVEETQSDRERLRDYEIERIRKSDERKR